MISKPVLGFTSLSLGLQLLALSLGSSVRAAEKFDLPALKSYTASYPYASALLASPESFYIPRYEDLITLPRASQGQVLEALRQALIDLDAEAHGVSTATATRRFDEWAALFIAEAQSAEQSPLPAPSVAPAAGPNFCINLGVVRPLSACDTSKGVHMHDFDTTDDLKALGHASECKDGGMPCSPAFGFDGTGALLCVKTNLTRDCAKLSRKAPLQLADVINACHGGSAGSAKVDCKGLVAFYNSQVDLVSQHCAQSAKRKACGILRDKLSEIAADLKTNAAATPETAGKQAADLAQVVNAATQMGSEIPCSPMNPSDRCAKAKFPTDKIPTFDEVIRARASVSGKPDCVDFAVEGAGALKIDQAGKNILLSYRPTASAAAAAAVPVSLLEMHVLDGVSHKFSDGKLPGAQLLSAYLPTAASTVAGDLVIHSRDGSRTKTFATRGWTTPSGDKIRYTTDGGLVSAGQFVVLVGITTPGQPESVIRVPVAENLIVNPQKN